MVLFYLSLALVCFAQNAWFGFLSPFSAAFGFALFWKELLCFSRLRQRFCLAVIWFSCVQGVQLSWMATLDYMGPLILIVYLGLILAMGVQFGLLSAYLVGRSLQEKKLFWSQILACSGLWVFFEWMRLFFLCGFTWNMVGLSLAWSSFSLQTASFFGVFGLSFWVIFTNLIAFKAFLDRKRSSFLLWSLAAVSPYILGFVYQSILNLEKGSSKLDVAIVQTNILPEEKDRILTQLYAHIPPLEQWKNILSALKEELDVKLIVFPEGALPLGVYGAGYSFLDAKKLFKEEFLAPLQPPYAIFHQGEWKVSNAFFCQSLANQFQANVIIGLDDIDEEGKYNAAFHFSPNRHAIDRYIKQVLVPVSEYIPLRNWKKLRKFIAEQYGIYSSFDAGKDGKIFHIPQPIGISICLEETFSRLIRDLRVKGAEVLVTIGNDAWFPRSKLAEQHLEHGRIRAVENGVPIIRSYNMGISAGIDAFGQIVSKVHPKKAGVDVLILSLPLKAYATPYAFWGDWGILSISFFCLLLPAFHLFLNKKKLP